MIVNPPMNHQWMLSMIIIHCDEPQQKQDQVETAFFWQIGNVSQLLLLFFSIGELKTLN